MSREITLILGGARSGKSRYAEALIRARPAPWIYLATAEAGDAEMAARIAHHQADRGPGWITVEEPIDIAPALRRHAGAGQPVLVDCLTLWISNLMMRDLNVVQSAGALMVALGEAEGPVVLVANEVGLGIVPDNPLARRFRDEAGRLNQRIAAIADTVIFVAAGLPLPLKGKSSPRA